MQTLEYSKVASLTPPSLFSRTKGFEFFEEDGKLTHQVISPGQRGFKIVAVTSSGHSAAFMEKDRTAITLPQSGHARVSTGKRDFSVYCGDLIALGPSERRSRLCPDPREAAYRSYTIISPPKWRFGLPDETLHRAANVRSMKLNELLKFSFDYLSNPELVSERAFLLHEALIEDAVIQALTPIGPDSEASARDCVAEGLARGIERFIGENFSDTIAVPQLADAMGVPVKTLQRAFRQRRGMTIRSYLTQVRLDAMHRTLARPVSGTTVTSACFDAGLFHLGRASAAYRQRFGEKPSDTLDRNST